SARPAPVTSVKPRVLPPPVQAANKSQTVSKPQTSKPKTAPPQMAAAATAPPAVAAVAPAASVPAKTDKPRTAEVVPAGRFFEPNDVDVAPKVARRIEPQLPADLK